MSCKLPKKPNLNKLRGGTKLSAEQRSLLKIPKELLTTEAKTWSDLRNVIDAYFLNVDNWESSYGDFYDFFINTLDNVVKTTVVKPVEKLIVNHCKELLEFYKNNQVKKKFSNYYIQKELNHRSKFNQRITIKQSESSAWALATEQSQLIENEAKKRLQMKRANEDNIEESDSQRRKHTHLQDGSDDNQAELNESNEDIVEIVEDASISFHSEDYHPLRKQKYKLMNICRNYDNENSAADWFFNGNNISQELREFGAKSLELNDKIENISDMRFLSLDHIYIISQSIEMSTTKYLGHGLHDDIISEVITDDIFPEVSQEIIDSCMKISLLNKNVQWLKVMQLAGRIVSKTLQSTPEDILYSSIIYKQVSAIWDISHSSSIEDTFVHNFVYHLISSMFSCDKMFQQEWANCTLETSRAYKPDWIASCKPWNKKYNIIIAEIKPPSKANRGALSDFVKLGREMKLLLDELIYSGVDNPESFGMLIQGNSLTLYTMDLKSPGIYRYIESDTLTLPMEFKDFLHFPRTLPKVYEFKKRIVAFVKKLEHSELQKAKGKSIKQSTPQSWLRHSADVKVHVI